MADAQLSETLEFLTQIHRSWDGTEQRAALRPVPRRYLSYEYIGVKTWQSQYLRALTYSQQTQLLQFPLWHAAATLTTNAPAGTSVLAVQPDKLWGYRGVSGVMLWQNDSLGGEVFRLNGLASDGTIAIGKELTENWHHGQAAICPVGWGVLQQEDKYVNVHSTLTTMQINVELIMDQEAPLFPAALDEYHAEPFVLPWGQGFPVQYQGAEVFMMPPPWTDDISASFSRNANRLDNQTGVFRYDLKSTDPSETKAIDYITTSRAEINNLQRFFYRVRGRQKSFWAPTWLSDLELAEDALAGRNYLMVKWPLYWKYYALGQRRKSLIAFMRDGSARLIKIAGYSTDLSGDLGKVYLDESLKQPLLSKDILMLSYLCKYRLDSDVLTTNYETTDVANMTFGMTEVSQ